MKHYFPIFLILSFCIIQTKGQIPVARTLYGQNVNLPAFIGSQNTGGHLDSKWPEIQASGVKYMRYGGIAAENFLDDQQASINDYYNKVVAMYDRSITPILQVPYDDNNSITTEAAKAGQIVKLVNQKLVQNGKPPVINWSISNEPELKGINTAAAIKAYIVPFSTAMRGQGYTVRIWGPELYNYDDFGSPLVTNLLSGTNSIASYIDVFTFHYYPMGDLGSNANYQLHKTRANLKKVLTQNCEAYYLDNGTMCY